MSKFESFCLRPITKKDYGFVVQILRDEKLQSMLLSQKQKKDDTAEAWHQRRNNDGFVWAISDKNKNFFGYIQITKNKEAQSSIFLGICLLESFRGYGLGSLAIKEVEKKLKYRGYKTLSLRVRHDNPALKLYERLGFYITSQELVLLTPRQDAIETFTLSKEL